MGDNCEACRTNTDPRKVPVHPNCDCEVVTQNVVTGVDTSVWQPIEQWVRDTGQLRFVQGNVGRPATTAEVGDPLMNITMEALTFDPGTMLVLDLEDARWSDIERWLDSLETILSGGEYVVAIVSDAQDAVEAVELAALGSEVLNELRRGRIFLGLLKVGLG